MKLLSLTLILSLGMVSANAADSFRTDINPALLSYQAFLAGPDLSPADKDYLFTNYWRSTKFPERFNQLVVGYDNQFLLLGRAAKSTVPCDWGIDLSAGPNALLPHLARSKTVAQVARFRVPWHLLNGKQEQATDELLAAFTLARNMSRDGTLIATLVQFAGEAIDCSTVALNFGRFSPAALKQLDAGLEQLPARRTVVDCLDVEKTYFLEWFVNQVKSLQAQYPGDDASVMAGIEKLMGAEEQPEGKPALWDRVKQASGGTSAGVLGLLAEREQTYQQLKEILALPYDSFAAQAESLFKTIETSKNPFIASSVPAILHARQRELRVQAYAAILRAAIAYKLNGPSALNSVLDPCGNKPFAFRRFVFQGVDRGFELKSAYDLAKNKAVLIFVETEGAPFRVDGNVSGEALPNTDPTR